MVPMPLSEKALSRGLLDIFIRAGLIVVLVLFCFEIFRPFRDLMLWSIILAITLYPLQQKLRGPMGEKDGRIATLIVLVAIAILMVPIYLLGTSIADSVENAMTVVRDAGHPDSATGRVRRRLATGGQTLVGAVAAGGHRPSRADGQVHTANQGRQPDGAGQGRRRRHGFADVHRRADHRRDLHGLWRSG